MTGGVARLSRSRTNHWKLGLFVVVGTVAFLSTFTWLGAQRMNRDTVETVTYFDESVQGLDVGSAVKFRGVPIGTVEHITVAPDRRHLKVVARIYVDVLENLGLSAVSSILSGRTLTLPPELRMSIASAGITGLKFLQVDFVDPAEHRASPLPFAPEDNYIAAIPSTLKSIEEPFMAGVQRLPGILDDLQLLVQRIHIGLDELEPGTVSKQLQGVLTTATSELYRLDAGGLSARLNETLAEASATFACAGQLLTELQREDGTLDSLVGEARNLTRGMASELAAARIAETTSEVRDAAHSLSSAADSVELLAKDLNVLTQDLQGSFTELRATLRSVRRLAEVLEKDPSSLVYGRTPVPEPGGLR